MGHFNNHLTILSFISKIHTEELFPLYSTSPNSKQDIVSFTSN